MNVLNFNDLLEKQLQKYADKTAFIFLADGEHEKDKLTYAELVQKSRRIAAHLQQYAQKGDRILLSYLPGLDFICAFLGCLYAGMIAVPTYPLRNNHHAKRLLTIVNDCSTRIVLGTRDSLAQMQQNQEFAAFQYIFTESLEDAEKSFQPIIIPGDTLAFLQYTSGSTGDPKGVMVSHGNLIANQHAIFDVFQVSENDKIISWLPMQHDMGLIGHLFHTIFCGTTEVFMSPTVFLEKPIRWLRTISHYKGFACGGPNFGYQLCVDKITEEQMQGLDLSNWHTAFNGSEPVRPSTLKEFAEKFAPYGFSPRYLLPCYGMAETTLLVSGTTKIDESRIIEVNKTAFATGQFQPDNVNSITLASSGQVDKSFQLKIVNPQTQEVANKNEIGEIWVSGASVALGYWNKPELTKETFGATLKNDPHHYLRTGDLGYLHEDNLYVTGRLKDLIILQGQNIYPQDVETAVEKCHPAIRQHCTAAFSVEVNSKEQLVIVAEVERTYRKIDFQPVFTAIRQAVMQAVDAIPFCIQLLQPAKALRTTSGKIQRRATKAAYEAGTLDFLVQDELFKTCEATILTRKQLETDICALLSKVLGVENVNPQQPFTLLGGTSLEAVTFQQQLQTYMGDRLSLSPTIAFDYPTVNELTNYLYAELTGNVITNNEPIKINNTNEPIAIIGMSCRFPGGANDPESFWQLLINGQEGISTIPNERFKVEDYKISVKHGGFIDGIDRFDAAFFNISPREAEMMDPQQRQLLELSWLALENAGIDPGSLRGSDTGVFIGATSRDYGDLLLKQNATDSYLATGNNASVLSGRLSYTLGLQGPCLTVDTACSSSLVALREAYHSLQRNDAPLAIVGGVNALLSPDGFINLSQANMLALDGRCKVFAENADGYVRGEGCGIVILKRLSDAERNNDNVLAIIKSIVVNQDGASSGLTVPNGVAQEKLLKQALIQAELTAADIDYFETHGTGTKLGDPMETFAIAEVYKESHRQGQPLYLGSVKANVGHLEAGAGMAGLIKVLLSLQQREIPPQPFIDEINSKINLNSIPGEIVQNRTAWERNTKPRRAAISSFSFSGTNAHIVLEEAPLKEMEYIPKESEPTSFIFTFSAKTPSALQQQLLNYKKFIEANLQLNIADLSYAQHVGRQHFTCRHALTAKTIAELLFKIDLATNTKIPNAKSEKGAKIAFLFTDNGKSLVNIQTLLKSSPIFYEAFTEANAAFKIVLPENKRDLLSRGSASDFYYYSIQTFCLQYALAAVWKSWGVIPEEVYGIGVGAYVAEVLTNNQSLNGAAALVLTYAEKNSQLPVYKKSIVIFSDIARIQNELKQEQYSDLFITEIHTANEIVISGPLTALQKILHWVKSQKMHAQWLSTSARPLDIIHYSEIEKLKQKQVNTFIEISSEPGFTNWGAQNSHALWASSLHPSLEPWHALLQNLVRLYKAGVSVDWKSFEAPYAERRHKIALPTYVFQQERHWAKALENNQEIIFSNRSSDLSSELGYFYQVNWKQFLLHSLEDKHEDFHVIDPIKEALTIQQLERFKHIVYIVPKGENAPSDKIVDGFIQTIKILTTLNSAPTFWIITRNAYMVEGSDVHIEHTPLNGLIKTAQLEHPDFNINQIDIETQCNYETLETYLRTEISNQIVNSLIAYREGVRYVAYLDYVRLTSPLPTIKFDKKAYYIITGGLGGLGFTLSAWLINQGARHIVLVARRKPSVEQEQQLKEWREEGIKVIIENIDISQSDAIHGLIQRYKHGLYPIKGIFHLAGTLQDGPLSALTSEQFTQTFAAKALGAWYLHQALEEYTILLDYFVLFSSVASLNGSPGQGNYAAANAFLDGLSYYRRLQNLAAISINWGPWAEVGMAKNLTALHERSGFAALAPNKALEFLSLALASNKVQMGIFDANWPKVIQTIPTARAWLTQVLPADIHVEDTNEIMVALLSMPRDQQTIFLQNIIVDHLKQILNLPAESSIDYTQSFFTLGLDSLMGLQLINQLRKIVGDSVQIKYENVLQRNSIQLLTDYILDQIVPGAGSAQTQIEVLDRNNILPLSFSQERLWFLQQLDPASCSYNEVAVIAILGDFKKEIVEQAYKKLIVRHESLRTRFVQEGENVFQKIDVQTDWHLNYKDLRGLSAHEREQQKQLLLENTELKTFDLSAGSLFRVLLIQLADEHFILSFTLHHIIADGWSVGILAREFVQVYNALLHNLEVPLLPLTIQYADYAHWQRHYMAGEVLENHLRYWQQQLVDAPLLNLPLDYPRPKILDDAGQHLPFTIPAELTLRLKELCQQQDISLYMLLLAAMYLLLSRYSAQTDICIGSPIANRTRPEIESVIGVFINMIVLRINCDPALSFIDLLAEVKRISLDAYAHQDVPFEKVVEAVVTDRNISHTALFDVMLVLQNTPLDPVSIQDLNFELMPNNTKIAKFDLTIELMEMQSELKGTIEYRTSLFKEKTIAQLSRHFINILSAIVESPRQRLTNFDFLNPSEKQLLLYDFNKTKVDFAYDKTAQALFEEQVKLHPHDIAVVFNEQTLTYQALNQKANQLARYLQTLNVKPEVLVGICIERSLEMIIGVLGILKAGGSYVPIDPNYPEERIHFMLQDAEVSVCLTEKLIRNKINLSNIETICLDELLDLSKDLDNSNLPIVTQPLNAAYVIYTSGSTGKPKGVTITQNAMVNFIQWLVEYTAFVKPLRYLYKTPFSFDVAVSDIFTPLLSGGTLVLAAPGEQLEPLKLIERIKKHQVTCVELIPSQLLSLLEEPSFSHDLPLQLVLTGGEALSDTIAEKFNRMSSIPLMNSYGPTECTVTATAANIALNDDVVTIGKPINNLQTYILDAYDNVVPLGAAGELCIAGVGLARGYYNKPDLTAEKFQPNPFGEPGSRLYRTGDLVRYLADGQIEYLGRIDHQVKIRGFRIELGEIESVLNQHPSIQMTLVVAHANTHLIAYITFKDNSKRAEINELRAYLGAQLPEYMVPAFFVFLDAFPFTTTGKIDRHILPKYDPTQNQKNHVPPRTDLEKTLVTIFANILDVEQVGIDDNFFELGGHSLMAVKVITEIRKALKRDDIPLSILFQTSTIRQIAEKIETGDIELQDIICLQSHGTSTPLFLLPGADGFGMTFAELARQMGQQRPIYAFQFPGLFKDITFATIEELATYYIQQMQTIQKSGPYYLCGWSMGGVVAFEMAKQLDILGEKLAFLGIIDITPESTNTSQLTRKQFFAGLLADNRFGVNQNQIKPILKELKNTAEENLLDFVYQHLLAAESPLIKDGKKAFEQILHTFMENDKILSHYSFAANLNKITYFPVKENYLIINKVAMKANKPTAKAWQAYSKQPVEVHALAGNHFTVLQKPAVCVLANEINTILNNL